jgi:hypothetical protein
MGRLLTIRLEIAAAPLNALILVVQRVGQIFRQLRGGWADLVAAAAVRMCVESNPRPEPELIDREHVTRVRARPSPRDRRVALRGRACPLRPEVDLHTRSQSSSHLHMVPTIKRKIRLAHLAYHKAAGYYQLLGFAEGDGSRLHRGDLRRPVRVELLVAKFYVLQRILLRVPMQDPLPSPSGRLVPERVLD